MISEMLNQLTDQLGDTYKKLNEAEAEIATLRSSLEFIKNYSICPLSITEATRALEGKNEA